MNSTNVIDPDLVWVPCWVHKVDIVVGPGVSGVGAASDTCYTADAAKCQGEEGG